MLGETLQMWNFSFIRVHWEHAVNTSFKLQDPVANEHHRIFGEDDGTKGGGRGCYVLCDEKHNNVKLTNWSNGTVIAHFFHCHTQLVCTQMDEYSVVDYRWSSF